MYFWESYKWANFRLVVWKIGLRNQMKVMINFLCSWEVVVAQLAERSLTIPEDPGLNPVIGNFY